MEFQLLQENGTYYIFGSTSRFIAGKERIRSALGELAEHIEFMRGSSANIAKDLIDYMAACRKWKVPENTESSSGWGSDTQEGTSSGKKRKTY